MQNIRSRLSRWTQISLLVLCGGATPAFAQITLGSADSFGVLGASTVTNTGATLINGNVGVNPGSAITGFPPGVIVGGVLHAGDAVALQAQSDVTVAYNTLAGTACDVDLSGQDLGGLTLTPGVYCYTSDAELTGALILDAQGMANPEFIFKFGSALTTASGSSVSIINGGNSCNVFWQVGSSATLGTGSSLLGNVLALVSITLDTGASVSGRLLARTGAVTLDGNSVTPCGPLGVCPTISVAPLTLPNAMLGAAYNQTVIGSGGLAPYTYTLSGGVLPTGLSLDPMTGVISGTATALGSFSFSFSFSITATDANGCLGSRAYIIEILPMGMCPTILVNPAALPAPLLGQLYSQQISASGGADPYTYTVTLGALPTGLTLGSATGVISGVPNAPGSFSFTITATDANGCPGSQLYTMEILPGGVCPTIIVNPAVLPAMILGQNYSQQVVASGGLAPYVYTLSAGALPNGLTLGSATGVISGVPVSPGSFSFTITATDANNCPGSRTYQLTGTLLAPLGLPSWSRTGAVVLLLALLGGTVLLQRSRYS